MNLANITPNSNAREKLEKAALEAVCACFYYDLADTIDSMKDVELEEIVANKGNHMPECAEL